jgi:hypothetical protein
MKSVSLSPAHYAYKWPTEDVVRTPAELTKLGAEFAALAEGRAKEDLLLEILQCFHGYLLKYVSMILRGHLPLQRNGRSKEVNKDTHLLLRCFIPREQASNRATLGAACRTLHLAFKGMDADEVYDQLMICLVKAIKRYDPHYSNKVKATVEVLDGVLKPRKKFTTAEVSSHLGQDAASYLRVLVKRGYLLSGVGTVRGESQYQRSELWPVPDSLFANGAVGLSYVASKWFRYYLVDYIQNRMSEIEAKKGVVQLNTLAPGHTDGAESIYDRGTPHAFGNLANPRTGRSAAVDLSLTEMPVDIGRMTLTWVNEEQGGVLEGLSKRDRHLLYCVFVREMDWESIATTFQVSAREAKRWYTAIIEQLQLKLGLAPAEAPAAETEELAA